MSKESHKPDSGKSSLAFGANLYFLFLVLMVALILLRVWNLMTTEKAHYQKMLVEKLYKDSTINVLRGSIISEEGAILSTTIPYYTLTVDLSAPYLSKPRRNLTQEKKAELKEHGVAYDSTKVGSNGMLDKIAAFLSGKKPEKKKTIFETELAITAEELAKTFGTRNKEEYMGLLNKWYKEANDKSENKKKPAGYRYRIIEKNVDYATYKRICNKGIFFPEKGSLSCLNKEERYRPVYPYDELALRTIGKNPTEEENKDSVLFSKQTGIQYSYNSYLAGVTGKVKRKLLGKKAYLEIDDENNIKPQNGSDVITTLDINMQDMVDGELRKTLTNHQAAYGTVVVMEVATGKIKAMANLGYDSLRKNYRELENYAVRIRSEPGSTFKLASLMAAMEKKGLTPDDRVDIQGGKAQVGEVDVFDTGHGKPANDITIQQVFERSSNVGVAKTIYRLFGRRKEDANEFLSTVKSFGLLNKTKIDLKGEQIPLSFSTSYKNWNNNYSLIKLSFGYFFQFTPLQILNFYNTVANNGKQMRPYIVSEIRYLDETVERFEPQVVNPKICSDKTLKWAQQLMVGVALNGTAKGRDSLEFIYAGKTGTVQLWNNPTDNIPNAPKEVTGKQNNYLFPDGKGGWTKHHQVSFVGYFPKDKPAYSIMVLINYPKTPEPTGGGIAAPLFREIAKKIYAGSLNYQYRSLPSPRRIASTTLFNGEQSDLKYLLKVLKIPYHLSKEEVIARVEINSGKYVLNGTRIPQKSMPDLIGMNLKDAMYLLEQRGIRPKIQGKGKIVSQSITAGSPIKAGMPLQLELAL